MDAQLGGCPGAGSAARVDVHAIQLSVHGRPSGFSPHQPSMLARISDAQACVRHKATSPAHSESCLVSRTCSGGSARTRWRLSGRRDHACPWRLEGKHGDAWLWCALHAIPQPGHRTAGHLHIMAAPQSSQPCQLAMRWCGSGQPRTSGCHARSRAPRCPAVPAAESKLLAQCRVGPLDWMHPSILPILSHLDAAAPG